MNIENRILAFNLGCALALAAAIFGAMGVLIQVNREPQQIRPRTLAVVPAVKAEAPATKTVNSKPTEASGEKETATESLLAPVPAPAAPDRVGVGVETARTIVLSAGSRTHPIRPEPSLVRVGEHQCLVIAPGAISYEQGGIIRPIQNPFLCTNKGHAREWWGSGTREITVEYEDHTKAKFAEVWP